VAAPRPTWPRRVVYEEGGLRDRTIFTAPIAGDPIRELRIVDPYGAAGSRARGHVIGFATMLLNDGQGVEAVRLVTLDADSVDVRDPETTDEQHNDMHARWNRAFRGTPLQYEQLSKNGNRRIHDRSVHATTRSGRKLIWDLGRGIDGVMTARHECTIILTEE
jgi:hypothetical protein